MRPDYLSDERLSTILLTIMFPWRNVQKMGWREKATEGCAGRVGLLYFGFFRNPRSAVGSEKERAVLLKKTIVQFLEVLLYLPFDSR
jgi:hypothetical protein